MEDGTDAEPREARDGLGLRSRRAQSAVVVVAAVIVFVVVRSLSGGGGTATAPPPLKRSVAVLTERGLRALALAMHQPIYWEGSRPGARYEVTQFSNGQLYVRYLPIGVNQDSSRTYPLVATFPLRNAFSTGYAVAHRPGRVTIPFAPNAIASYGAGLPTKVLVAMRGLNYQIEVFDPNPGRLRKLVANDVIEPISPSASGAVTASKLAEVSRAELDVLPSYLGHPVYWVGPQAGARYELTIAPTGNIFVRYLPRAAKIGASVRYRFVASLPVPNAFTVTSEAAVRPSSVKLRVPGGGVALYGRSLPTNIYIAFPGSDYQIEVFDPNPRRARALVTAGLVHPVP